MIISNQPNAHSLETIEKIITLFVCESLTCYEIGDIVGVNYTIVGRYISRYLGPKINRSVITIQSTWSTE